MSRIGFIGGGSIGAPMARRLLESGFELSLCDVDVAVRARFARLDVSTCAVARDLAPCDTVVIMVADDGQVIDVILGPDGFVAGPAPAEGALVLVMSTVSPATVSMLGERLAVRGISIVDAPVSGGPARAERGELTIMVGGDAPAVARARPILECLASHIHGCGGLGSGAIAKLVNNMLGIANLYLAAEAYALAACLGARLETILPVIEQSTGRNFSSASAAEAHALLGAFTGSEAAFRSLVKVVTKDLALVDAVRGGQGLTLPLFEGVRSGVSQMNDEDTADQVLAQWRNLLPILDRSA